MNARPKILFLDIGGVLLSDGWGHESRQEAARLFGLDFPEMDRLHNVIFNVYEIGKITLDNYLDIAVFNKERKFSRQEFKEFMFKQSTELPRMLDWLIQWKQQRSDVRIISISNEGKELNDYRVKKFGLHRCFDAFISSCEVGMSKPDPGIFRLAAGIARAEPQQCLYFDDRLIQVEAAKRAGIQAYQHRDFETTKALIEGI
jgi:putative hydrolase of the HAD superfamily